MKACLRISIDFATLAVFGPLGPVKGSHLKICVITSWQEMHGRERYVRKGLFNFN
jgi:hypothetical protein